MKRIIAMLSVLLAIALLFAGAACAEEIAIEEEAAAIEEAFALEAEEEPEEEMEVEAAVSEEALPPEEALEAVETAEAEAEPEAVSVEESLEEALLPASGVWGTCPWEISADGVLTIHAGTGEDTCGYCPWYDYGEKITAVAATEPIVLPADSSCLLQFCSCASMDLSGFDTSNVTNMRFMFAYCSSLSAPDASGSDIGAVLLMGSTFRDCDSLTTVKIGKKFSFKGTEDTILTTLPEQIWRSTVNGNVYSSREIAELRSNTADTYTLVKPSTGGTIRFEGHTYAIYDRGLKWHDAESFCEAMGGHLVTITSSSEQAALKSIMDTGKRNCYWTGGLKDSNLRWTWITGESFTYTNWCPNEPNNFTGSEDRIHLYNAINPSAADSYRYGWNDLRSDCVCNNEEFFLPANFGLICEWDFICYPEDQARPIVNAQPVNTNAARITWNRIESANRYQLWRSDHGGDFKWIKNCSTTEVNNYSLTPGADYKYKVRPYYENPDGTRTYGEFSNEASVHILGKITNLTGRGKDTNCAFLRWDKVSGCTGYQLFRTIEGTGGEYTWVKNCTTPEVANYDLKAGTVYYYKVRAYIDLPGSQRAYGQFSSPVRVAILPQGSIISLIGSPTTGKVHLTWKSIPGVTGYQLFTGPYAGSAPNWACNTTLPLSDVTQRVTQGTARSFRVRGYIQYEDGTRYYGQFSDVVNTIQSTGIALSADGEVLENYGEVFVDNGGTLRLTPVFTPANTTLQTAAWSSTNETVATVNSKGVVTGLRPGKAYIKATPQDGGRSAVYCLVTVRPVYRALLIGNGRYTKASGSNPLDPICELDAAHLTSALSRRHGENNADWKITVQNELDGPEILTWIGNVFGSAREGDVNLFFYSGHGLAVMNDAGQILVRDPRTGSLCGVQGGNVTPAELVNRMNQCPGTFICLFDSCCSGAYIAQNGAALPDGSIDDPGADIFLSSLVGAFAEGDPGVTIPLAPSMENGEIAVPEPGYGEMQTAKYYVLAAAGAFQDSRVQDIDGSYFTNGLVYLAIGGAEQLVGDANRDGKLSLYEAYNAVEDYVKLSHTSQRTQIYPFASSYPILYQ